MNEPIFVEEILCEHLDISRDQHTGDYFCLDCKRFLLEEEATRPLDLRDVAEYILN